MFVRFFFFFFKQKTAYEMLRSLVGSEMCIRDRYGMFACTYSILYNAPIARAITEKGRDIIRRLYVYLHVVHELKPIYCDTDSVFIHVLPTDIECVLKNVNIYMYSYSLKIEFAFDRLYIKCMKSYFGSNTLDDNSGSSSTSSSSSNNNNNINVIVDYKRVGQHRIVLKGIFNTFYNQPLCSKWVVPNAVHSFLYSKTRGLDIISSFNSSTNISTFKSTNAYSEKGAIWSECTYENISTLLANESVRLNKYIGKQIN